MAIDTTSQEWLTPLTFTAEEAGSTIKLEKTGYPEVDGLQYRTDSSAEFEPYTIDTVITLANVGDYVQFQNTNTTLGSSDNKYVYFQMTGKIAASGNIQSMLNYSVDISDYAFYKMFSSAKALSTFPAIIVNKIGNYACRTMFRYSTFPTIEIQADSIGSEGCYGMLLDNTSLTTAQVQANSIDTDGCELMFGRCSALNSLRINFTSWGTTTTPSWMKDVASTGELICPSSLDTSTRGVDTVPEGWTVFDIDKTLEITTPVVITEHTALNRLIVTGENASLRVDDTLYGTGSGDDLFSFSKIRYAVINSIDFGEGNNTLHLSGASSLILTGGVSGLNVINANSSNRIFVTDEAIKDSISTITGYDENIVEVVAFEFLDYNIINPFGGGNIQLFVLNSNEELRIEEADQIEYFSLTNRVWETASDTPAVFSGADVNVVKVVSANPFSATLTLTTSETLVIAVTTPVAITGIKNKAIEDTWLKATVYDGTTPIYGDLLKFSSENLPDGLSVSSGGLISGTPTVSGTFTAEVTVSATGADDKIIEVNFTIEDVRITVQSPVQLEATVNEAFEVDLNEYVTVNNGTEATFATENSIDGVSLSSNGALSGNIATEGEYTLSVVVSADGAESKTIEVNFTIAEDVKITLSQSEFELELEQNETFSVDLNKYVTVSNGSAASFELAEVIEGVTLTAGGVLSGAVTTASECTLNITVSADGAEPAKMIVTLTVIPVISVTTPVTVSGTVGTAIVETQLEATVSDGGSPTFSASNLPAGITCSSSGIISGTPAVSGAFTAEIAVSYERAENKVIVVNFSFSNQGGLPSLPETNTTAEKLQLARTLLEKIRNNKNALKTKFGLADTLPFSQYADSIGGGEFYKCAEVGTGTWTGYKAYFVDDTENDEKYYDFETELTGDTLTYGYGFTPEVGSVYDAEALIKAVLSEKDPLDGYLLFYAPLTAQSDTAKTGQALTTTGTVTYQTVDNRQCAYFDGSSYIQFSDVGMPAGSAERSIACWVKIHENIGGWQHILGYGGDSAGAKFYMLVDEYGAIGFTRWAGEFTSSVYPESWTFVVITHKDGVQKIYANGEQVADANYTIDTVLLNGHIGCSQNPSSNEFFNGYVADARIYNKALSAEEVTALYQRITA